MSESTPVTTATIYNWPADPSNRYAYEQFAKRYRARMVIWCRSVGFGEADAEDAVQDLLCKIPDKIHLYKRERGSFRQWLRTVLRNVCLDVIRKDTRYKHHLETLAQKRKWMRSLRQASDEIADEEIHLIALNDVKSTVLERDWIIYTARISRTQTSKALAEQFNVSTGVVEQALSRVRKKLRQRINELEGKGAESDGAA